MAYNRIHARRICNNAEYALFNASLQDSIGKLNSAMLQSKMAQAKELCVKHKKTDPKKFKVMNQALSAFRARLPVERALEKRRAVKKASELRKARKKTMPPPPSSRDVAKAPELTAAATASAAKAMRQQSAASIISLGHTSSLGRRNQGKRDQKQG